MTLVQLEYARAVAKTGSISQAARQCHVTQPTLTLQLRKLEEQLGTALFERDRHPLRATPRGQRLLEQAARVLAEAHKLRSLAGAAPAPLLFALLLVPLIQWLRAWRFGLMMSGSPQRPERLLIRTAVLLNLFNYLLPFRVGEASFPILMKRHYGMDYSRAAGILILVRLMDACTVVALLCAAANVVAAEGIEPFVGEYRGRAISDTAAGLDERDLSVVIEAKRKGGFVVEWTTVARGSVSGKLRKSSYTVEFITTKRPNIYSSAMKTNVFGGRQAMDPLEGDPYVWARIDGKTLTLHALIITQEGGYEIQVYDRTLTEDGMELRFSRVRDGEVLKQISGTLERVD